MARIACYVDGFNLYHAMADIGKPSFKWLNLHALAKSFCDKNDELAAVYYFTSVHNYAPEKCKRHRRYIDALRAVGVTVIESKFQRVDKYCREQTRSCGFLEEKQTDVALATTFLSDAMENFMDRAILMTADSDQVPAVRMVRKRRPLIQILLATPPGRLNQSRELGNEIPDRREISAGRIGTCLLPRTVYKADGKVAATCPSVWADIGEVMISNSK